MGLAASPPTGAAGGYKITYYPPQPRAVIQVVDPDDPEQLREYAETGRVMLTTLTKEFFVPRFVERNEGEREPGVRPVSMGWRQRRAIVQPTGHRHDRRRVLRRDVRRQTNERQSHERAEDVNVSGCRGICRRLRWR